MRVAAIAFGLLILMANAAFGGMTEEERRDARVSDWAHRRGPAVQRPPERQRPIPAPGVRSVSAASDGMQPAPPKGSADPAPDRAKPGLN